MRFIEFSIILCQNMVPPSLRAASSYQRPSSVPFNPNGLRTNLLRNLRPDPLPPLLLSKKYLERYADAPQSSPWRLTRKKSVPAEGSAGAYKFGPCSLGTAKPLFASQKVSSVQPGPAVHSPAQ